MTPRRYKPPTQAQLSSIQAVTSRYGNILRQHTEKDGSIILHCQKLHDPSAKLFRIHPSGLTDLI